MKSYSLYRDSSDACAWVKQDDEVIQSLPMDSQQPCFCIACRPEDEPAVSTDNVYSCSSVSCIPLRSSALGQP